ncbi:hypothetical protein V8G54_014635 [Vigna mungo]|uniref:Uncharacterized protein n=1 Tax=Vigna mungo TaxID=3915 RepID=A0AAQ3NJJ0_VIGMU
MFSTFEEFQRMKKSKMQQKTRLIEILNALYPLDSPAFVSSVSAKSAENLQNPHLGAPEGRWAPFNALFHWGPGAPFSAVVFVFDISGVLDIRFGRSLGRSGGFLTLSELLVMCPYGVYPDILLTIHAQLESDESCGENSRRS